MACNTAFFFTCNPEWPDPPGPGRNRHIHPQEPGMGSRAVPSAQFLEDRELLLLMVMSFKRKSPGQSPSSPKTRERETESSPPWLHPFSARSPVVCTGLEIRTGAAQRGTCGDKGWYSTPARSEAPNTRTRHPDPLLTTAFMALTSLVLAEVRRGPPRSLHCTGAHRLGSQQ